MKLHSLRLPILLFAILLIGVPCFVCFVWVRKEQRQYVLNRQLIEALEKFDVKQALVLVKAGADPNTRYEPTPVPSWSELMNQWLCHAPPPANNSPTALMVACVAYGEDEKGEVDSICLSDADLSSLLQAMLVHGANPNAKDGDGLTALCYLVVQHPDKELVQQLLTAGADPNSASVYGFTPLKGAKTLNQPDIVALLRKYSKHP